VTDTILELRPMRATLAEVLEVQQDLQRRLLDRDDRRTGIVLLPLAVELVGTQTFDAAGLAAARGIDSFAVSSLAFAKKIRPLLAPGRRWGSGARAGHGPVEWEISRRYRMRCP